MCEQLSFPNKLFREIHTWESVFAFKASFFPHFCPSTNSPFFLAGSVCFFENVCRSMHSFSPPPSDVFFSLILAVVLASRPNGAKIYCALSSPLITPFPKGDLFVSSGRECVRILAASVSPHHFALLMKTILLQLSSPFPHQVLFL